MGQFGTKKLKTFDTRKVGEVIQALANPDPTRWIPLDGGIRNRADWPEFATLERCPAGIFTATVRTLASAPAQTTIASDGTYFVSSGAQSTIGQIQTTTTGASWAQQTPTSWNGTNLYTPAIIYAGTRFIATSTAGAAPQPVVAVDPTGTWTATTGGTYSVLPQGLAYSPELGRTVMAQGGSLATASSLFYMNDGSTTWAACNGGSTVARSCVVWTGKYFIAFVNGGNIYQISADGITWSDMHFQNSGLPVSYPAIVSAASNGKGTVMSYGRDDGAVYNGNSVYLVSKDHGMRWIYSMGPELVQQLLDGITRIQYINGKFFMLCEGAYAHLFSSVDGLTIAGTSLIPGISTPSVAALAYKAGVYCGLAGVGQTAAATMIEDTSKFRTPRLSTVMSSNVGFQHALGNTPAFVKARSN